MPLLPSFIRRRDLSRRARTITSNPSPHINRRRHSSKFLTRKWELKMLDKVREIIADVTHNNLQSVTANSSSQNLDGWDSVAQINIIVAVEEEFGIRFDPEDMHNLDSVEKIVYALSPIMVLREQ